MKKIVTLLISLFFLSSSNALLNANFQFEEKLKEFNKTKIASGMKGIALGYLTYITGKKALQSLDKAVGHKYTKRNPVHHLTIAGSLGYVSFNLGKFAWEYAQHALDIKNKINIK